jgi:DNA-binding GntR family transcriptional regulator
VTRAAVAPRYQSIADELRAAIAGGALPPGAPFPTEADLMRQHQVSRFTVREALRRLEAEGLIARRRGSGTTVEARPGVFRRDLSNLDEILQYDAATRFDFPPLGLRGLTRDEAAALGRVAGERWHVAEGRRVVIATGETIALVSAFVAGPFAAEVARLTPRGGPIFQQLERLTGRRIARVTQEIRALAATAAQADALGLARRAPCLQIVRGFFLEGGETLEYSRSIHPAERFHYSMHIDLP